MMLGIQVFCYGASRLQVWRVFEAHRECLEFLSVPFAPAGGDGGDEVRVEPTGEEDTYRYVAHHLSLDGPYELVAHPFQDVIGDWSAGLRGTFEVLEVLYIVGDCGGEAHEAILGGPVVTGRKDLNVLPPVFVERPHLRGEAD